MKVYWAPSGLYYDILKDVSLKSFFINSLVRESHLVVIPGIIFEVDNALVKCNIRLLHGKNIKQTRVGKSQQD